jgi:predicted extracellular nuclease
MKRFVVRAAFLLALFGVMAGAAQAASPNVVISEFRTRGPAGGNDEFIELYNRSTSPVPIGGWQILGSSNTAPTGARATITAGRMLDPGCHYLVPGSAYSGSVAGDQAGYGTGISDNGGVAIALPDGTIVDQVGVTTTGTAYREGTALTTQLSTNADRSYARKGGGAQDTDDNATDFVLTTPSGPQNSTALYCDGVVGPTPPSGTGSATPSSLEAGDSTQLKVDVTPGANPTSTGIGVTCNAASIGAGTVTLSGSGNTFSGSATVASGTTTGGKSVPCTITDAQSRSGNVTISLTVVAPAAITHVHTVQGASQVSPLAGTRVANVRGIVTAVDTNGFYLQDSEPDADPATSEGVFVFTSSAPTVAVGDAVRVDALVSEFIPGGSSSGNLPTTELSGSPTVAVLSRGNALPDPVVAHPPTTTVEDDSAPDVRNGNTFDPDQDGLDYWESLEAMRVQVNDPVAVGPQNSFRELPVVGSDFGAAPRTVRGGLMLTATDSNPERIILDDQLVSLPAVVNVGDHFDGPATGVLNYNFGNFMLEVTQSINRIDSGLQKEITAAAATTELSIATFNVENLDISDGAAKFDGLADRIVNNLRSPKIVTLEEVQDNNGETDNGVTNADTTLNTLVAAIESAGGPHYSYTYIDPVNDQDGGAPGGNIRIAFLYNEAAGVSLAPGTKGGSTDAESVTTDASGAPHLALNPGRIDPTNDAWSTSRKPLAGEFVYRGQTFFVIGNHFNSKGGDDPLMGRFQPPVRSSEVQRHKQAQLVHDFVGSILAHDPNAKIVVLGDLNDFQFSDTVHILEGGSTPILNDMIDTLPQNEQYSYEFEGNAQVLDHILVSNGVSHPAFDVVHINAEFADQLSDHDPSVLRIAVNSAPVVSAGGPYTVAEAGTTTLTGTATDAEGDQLTYAWDLDGDGTTDATTPTVSFVAGDGPADVDVALTVSDGVTSTTAHTVVHVTNVAPTATLTAPASAVSGSTFTISLDNAADVSPSDASSLQFAFDCGSGFGSYSSAATATCTAAYDGTQTVGGRVQDKDGGVSTYTASVRISVTVDSVCALVQTLAKNDGQATSLCAKLQHGQIDAFGHEVDAQTGKAFTAEQAALLKRLAAQV